jgi:hypothetical protein
MAGKRWSELSDGQRRLVVVGGVVEAVLKVIALRDLRQRPAEQVRGPKAAWATGITLVNGLGIAPLTYFLLGRRKPIAQ